MDFKRGLGPRLNIAAAEQLCNYNCMKPWHLWISIAAIFIFGILFSQDTLARLAWQKIHRPAMALALLNKDEKLAMQLGSYYFNGGAYNLKRAKTAYKKALKSDYDPLWANYQLARVYFVEGNYPKALEYINKELGVYPENLRSLYVRGLIYGYQGNLSEAEDDFKKFTSWAPKEWGGYNDLAWILSKQRKYKEAGETIKKALAEVPNADKNSWLWNSLGVAELNLKEYEKAKTSFKKAKILAQNLSPAEWKKSYPGNNPRDVESGLEAFRNALEENLKRADVDNPK